MSHVRRAWRLSFRHATSADLLKMEGFNITMTGLVMMGESARQDVEPFAERTSLESLYRVPAGKIWRNEVRLRRSVLSRAGVLMRVNMVIQLDDSQSLQTYALEEAIRDCCSTYFEYAISTPHSKTVLCGLRSREGVPVGDLTATFLVGKAAWRQPTESHGA